MEIVEVFREFFLRSPMILLYSSAVTDEQSSFLTTKCHAPIIKFGFIQFTIQIFNVITEAPSAIAIASSWETKLIADEFLLYRE
jgi:hypothetical protein